MYFNLKKLPDICDISTGKHNANHATENGKYRFYTCANQFTYCDTKSFSGENIIVPGNGDIGLVFYYNGEFDAYQRTYVLSNIKINARYLYYHLLYQWKHVNKSKQYGSTVRYVRISNFNSYEVPVPSSLEQERIVAKIEELFSNLDQSISELHLAQEKLEVYRQAVYLASYNFTTDMHPITDFFEISGGLTKNPNRNKYKTKMPYLRVANVYYNALDLSEIKEIGVEEHEIQKLLLKKNDLLFVEGNGSKSQIGRVAIWDDSIQNCLHQNHLIKGRPKGTMLSSYALFYLISDKGRKQIINIARSTSGLYTLSTNKIKSLKLPYVELRKQKEIVNNINSQLSILNKIDEILINTLKQAEALRQSILKKAFEGGLV